MKPKTTPRVAILVDTATGWGRRLVQGVVHYTQANQPWHLWVSAITSPISAALPPDWRGEGVIARVATEHVARQLKNLHVPVINVSAIHLRGWQFPCVTTDVHAAAEIAVEHFMGRGLRHFAYYSTLRARYTGAHRIAFCKALERVGQQCTVYHPPRRSHSADAHLHLIEWLRDLPKPVALFSWALQGLTVLNACRDAQLRVPDEVAVLAGDDDEVLCNTSVPAMSGIEIPSELMGHRAAEMLDQLMRGRKLQEQSVLLRPNHIVTRPSTDTLALEDPELVSAIRFIRDHDREPIDVSNVLEEVPVSRCWLERKFREVLGRTPAEEIRRVHLERAKQLLLETDMLLPAVAAASGFGSPEYLSYAFKAAMNISPSEYRRKQQAE